MQEGWGGLLSQAWTAPEEQRFHMDSPDTAKMIARAVYDYGAPLVEDADELLLLCVGTDRSIGDAFGPLVGSHIAELPERPYTVLGTLDHPVHASNLSDTIVWIGSTYKRPLIIAVDACLGRAESVGVFTVGRGSLKPGAGVNKRLPSVGQVYVTAVVNVGGFMEYFVLQNTRLSLVARMAKVAAAGLADGLSALALRRKLVQAQVEGSEPAAGSASNSR